MVMHAPRLTALLPLAAAASGVAAATVAGAPTAEEMKQLRLLDCSLNSASLSDCDAAGYAIRAGFFLAPALLVAVLMLLAFPVYASFKYCCNACGGRNQTIACCCACGSPKPLYARFNLWRAKLYAIVIAGVCVVFFIVGTAGAAKTFGGLSDLANEATGIKTALDGQVDRIEAALVVRMYHQENDTEYDQNLMAQTGINVRAEAEKITKDFDKIIQDATKTFKDILSKYSWTPYLIFGLPLCVFVVGAVIGLLNCRTCLPMTLMLLTLVLGSLMWILHGTSSLLAFAVGDACAEINGNKNGDLTVLKAASSCQDSWFSGFQSKFTELEASAAKKACDPIVAAEYKGTQTVQQNVDAKQIFAMTATDCSSATFASVYSMTEDVSVAQPIVDQYVAKKEALALAEKTLADAKKLAATTPGAPAVPASHQTAVDDAKALLVTASESLCTESMADPTVKCTMRMCAKTCLKANGTLSQSGRLAKFLTVTFQSAAKASTALDTIGADYTNCDAAFRVFVGSFAKPCDGSVAGFVVLRLASGGIGILSIVFAFVMAFGAKRFAAYVDPDEAEGEKEIVGVPYQ